MKKIGFCIDSLEMGGAEKLLVDIINLLYETKEYEISVLTKYKSDSYFYKLIEKKVNYFYLLEENTDTNLLCKLKNSIIKNKNFKNFSNNVDIIIDFLDGDFYKYVSKVKNKLKIIWVHSSYKNLQLRKKIDYKIEYYDKIVVIVDEMEKEIRIEKKNIENLYKIYNFIDFSIINSKIEENLEIDFDIKQEYFLTVCRLNEEQKDVKTLIEAFSMYEGKEKLVIVGDGQDRAYLENLSNEKGLADRVIFLGALTNPFILMKNAKTFILSSKTEGFGLVLVEALYCGTKVISSDCPVGPKEILLNGEIGELFKVGDKKDLIDKLNIALNKEYDKEKIKKLLERYTKKNFIEKFKEILR